MKTLAPELKALMSIFASVGPVISTRRFASAGGAPFGAGRQDPVSSRSEPALEFGDEGERFAAEDSGLPFVDRPEDFDTVGQGQGSGHGRLLRKLRLLRSRRPNSRALGLGKALSRGVVITAGFDRRSTRR
jgi:hypothetical protein